MTTYSVDPAFYDSFIERRLRRSGCENNILLADSSMLTRALSSTPAAFRLAGRKYAIVPVSVEGCFHPKIHLRFGRDKARLIISSANATAAGWCRNLEVLADLDWNPRAEESPHGSMIRRCTTTSCIGYRMLRRFDPVQVQDDRARISVAARSVTQRTGH